MHDGLIPNFRAWSLCTFKKYYGLFFLLKKHFSLSKIQPRSMDSRRFAPTRDPTNQRIRPCCRQQRVCRLRPAQQSCRRLPGVGQTGHCTWRNVLLLPQSQPASWRAGIFSRWGACAVFTGIRYTSWYKHRICCSHNCLTSLNSEKNGSMYLGGMWFSWTHIHFLH